MFREDINRFIEKRLHEAITFGVTMLGDSAIIVEGHKGIRSYNASCMQIKISNNYISIYGDNLTIEDINDVDIIISGRISKVVVHDE